MTTLKVIGMSFRSKSVWFASTSIAQPLGPQCLFVERREGSDGDLFPTATQDTGRRDWGL